jgi:hypothetical protein
MYNQVSLSPPASASYDRSPEVKIPRLDELQRSLDNAVHRLVDLEVLLSSFNNHFLGTRPETGDKAPIKAPPPNGALSSIEDFTRLIHQRIDACFNQTQRLQEL